MSKTSHVVTVSDYYRLDEYDNPAIIEAVPCKSEVMAKLYSNQMDAEYPKCNGYAVQIALVQ